MTTKNILTIQEDGSYIGTLRTLKLRLDLELRPTDETSKGPDYEVIVGGLKIGAVFEKTSMRDGTLYYNMELNDPALGGKLYYRLYQTEVRGELEAVYSYQK